MREALHLRFEPSVGHQHITIFMAGGSCGTLTMRPEEALWFNHICTKGCESLRLTFNATGKLIDPPTDAIDRFALEHTKGKQVSR